VVPELANTVTQPCEWGGGVLFRANGSRNAPKLAIIKSPGDCTVLFFDLSFGVSFTYQISHGGRYDFRNKQTSPGI